MATNQARAAGGRGAGNTPFPFSSVAAPQVAGATVPEPVVAPLARESAEFTIDVRFGYSAAGLRSFRKFRK